MITSPSNPTVKLMRALNTSKGRREHRQFLVEGVRAVEEGIKEGFRPAICLYNADLLARTDRGQALLQALLSRQGSTSQVWEASDHALAAASDTQHPQGVVAAFPFIEWPEDAGRQGTSLLVLICDDVQDPGNLGTLLRTAEAAGVTQVWLTPRCVDLYSPKVVRAAMGAHFRLPIYPEIDWPLIEKRLAGLGIPADQVFATDATARQPYDAVDWTGPAALIISNEAHGPSTEARQLAQEASSISIPMLGATESLNAAIAGAVVLFEAARQRRNVKRKT